MNNIYFEELNEARLNEVLDIYNYYVLNTTATWHLHTLTAEEMRELVFSKNDLYRTYIIQDDTGLCGYVSLRQWKTREAYSCTAEISIYLRAECSAKGIGSVALQHIERYAKEKGIHVVIAGISGDNTSSIKLFEKNGFIKCAHYKEVGIKFGKLLDVLEYQKIIS